MSQIIDYSRLRPGELKKISEIATYYRQRCNSALDVSLNQMDAELDITSVHLMHCPLDLDAMLRAIDTGEYLADLHHDLSGIWNHWNRQEFVFDNFMTPRLSDHSRRPYADF